MRVTQIIADVGVPDLAAAREFWVGYLGLAEESLGLGWVTRLTAPPTSPGAGTGWAVQLVSHDATAPENPTLSVRVDDVEAAHAEAQRRGYEIVHPLTTETWGVTRFFVRAPDGTLLNVLQHRDRPADGSAP